MADLVAARRHRPEQRRSPIAPSTAIAVSLLLGAVALVSCGSAGSAPPESIPSGDRPTLLPLCRDTEPIRGEVINPDAPPLGPTQNVPEPLVVAVNEVGERHPESFSGRWIDRDSNTFAIAFTTDLEARRSEVLDAVGGSVRTSIVEAEHTMEELLAVAARIGESDAYGENRLILGTSIRENYGLVWVAVDVLDAETIEAVTERFGGEPVCLEGADPSDYIPPGPQPTGGDGWRLLADEPGLGRPWATGYADSEAQLGVLLDDVGLDVEPPVVDFSTEAVIWFGPAVSGSCPDIRLDDVIFDLEERMVRPLIVLPGGWRTCTGDANPHAYLVAVLRDRLPDTPFTVELLVDACENAPGVCEEQRTLVD